MPRDSLHTVFMAAKLLGIHCNGCSHRAVLGASELPKMHNNMALLRSLKLRCKNCGLRGTGRKEFALSIPREELEAEAFLQGRNIKGWEAKV